MLISEILRIKGNALFTTTPEGKVIEAVKVMTHYDVGSLVVMESGQLVGMLTFREVLRALDVNEGALGSVTVGDIMVRNPYRASPHDSVEHVTNGMLAQKVRYVPIMEDNTLLGVISFHDIQKAALEETAFENKMLKGYIKNWPEE